MRTFSIGFGALGIAILLIAPASGWAETPNVSVPGDQSSASPQASASPHPTASPQAAQPSPQSTELPAPTLRPIAGGLTLATKPQMKGNVELYVRELFAYFDQQYGTDTPPTLIQKKVNEFISQIDLVPPTTLPTQYNEGWVRSSCNFAYLLHHFGALQKKQKEAQLKIEALEQRMSILESPGGAKDSVFMQVPMHELKVFAGVAFVVALLVSLAVRRL